VRSGISLGGEELAVQPGNPHDLDQRRARRGEPERAARLLGAAEALREAMGTPLPPTKRDQHAAEMMALEGILGKPAFEAARTAGRATTWQQACAWALDEVVGRRNELA